MACIEPSSEKLNPDQLQLALEELRDLQDALELAENPELWEKIGEERSEQLDVVPARFFKVVAIRPKYKKIADRSVAPVVAPAPKRLIENSCASAGLILHIILGKYCDHLPLYRQEQIFIRYQDPQKDYCPNGYLWAYHSPGVGVLFEWYPSRAAKCIDSMLCGYQGLLQSDGYVGYTSWLNNPKHATEKSRIIHAACWAHARRKFVESFGHPVAAKVVKLIAKLYRIETKLRENPDLVENAIRPTAIGKKNWHFFGSPRSGQDSAILYSLIETCRKLEINPATCLRDLFEALPTMEQSEVENWTPAKWEAARESQTSSES